MSATPETKPAAKPHIAVTLEVIHDKATGLSFNKFTWVKDGKLEILFDLANQPASVCAALPMAVCAYNEELDLPLAKARRAAIEERVNQP